MSVLDRLRADTGAPYPAWLYLAHKASDTAGFTLIAMLFGVALFPASIIALLIYVVGGKLKFLWQSWKRAHGVRMVGTTYRPRFVDESFNALSLGAEVRDTIFDALLSGLVVGVALLITKGLTLGATALGTLIITIAILLNAHWGRPPG